MKSIRFRRLSSFVEVHSIGFDWNRPDSFDLESKFWIHRLKLLELVRSHLRQIKRDDVVVQVGRTVEADQIRMAIEGDLPRGRAWLIDDFVVVDVVERQMHMIRLYDDLFGAQLARLIVGHVDLADSGGGWCSTFV